MAYKQITIPEWTQQLPGHSYLSSSDIAPMFGYKSANSIPKAVETGRIPKPDNVNLAHFNTRYSGKFFWRLSSLRLLAAEQEKAA